MQIEIICHRSGIFGGIKRLYELASYFLEANHNVVINIADGSTNTWFKHNIPENRPINPDLRIVPETHQQLHPTAKNILYVQAQFDPPEHQYNCIITTTPYLADYIVKAGFSVTNIIPYGFDSTKFKPDLNKQIKNYIGYMPRKGKQEIDLIKNCFSDQSRFIEIDNLNESETIIKLQSCDYFLATSRIEGFGMPVFEASLCGCLVIGYHGKGGKYWLTPNTFAPCQFPQEFVSHINAADTGTYESIRHNLRNLILQDLTIEKEKSAWLNVIHGVN